MSPFFRFPHQSPSVCSFLRVTDKFHTHTKQQENYNSVYHPKWPNERTHYKYYQTKKSLLSKTEIQNKFICLWGWIQDSRKSTKLKKEQARRAPSTTLLLQVYNHYFHLSCEAPYHTLVFRMVSLPCHGSGDCAIPLISLAMPVVAQLLEGSPKPHRSRVRFQAKRYTLVFQVKAWALGWHSNTIKNKLTEKNKIKIEFTTR